MRKNIFIMACMAAVSLSLLVPSCKMDAEHVHVFKVEWTYDEANHWYAAICEHSQEKSGFAKHSFGDWEEENALTLGRFCTECGYGENKVNFESIKATNLPIVEIDTADHSDITSKEDWKEATMGISNATEQTWNIERIRIEIKGRGNSSWGQPKKPYAIKLDEKQEICGMPKHKRWVLLANYSDKTLLRNYIASELGTNIYNTVWNPSFEFVHLILNGEYNGVYLLGEQIKIDGNRIDIQGIDEIEDDINEDSFVDINDGGFICEINARKDEIFNFDTAKGVPISLKDPDEVDSGIQEKVKEIVQNAEDVLYGENWLDETNGYKNCFDVDSLIDWYIVNEFTKNPDAIFFSSVYFYYNPKDNLLHMGPNWDFDISCGNIDYAEACESPEGYYIKNAKWISRLFEDENFVQQLKARWNEKKQELHTFIRTAIQSKADILSEAATLNFLTWDILGKYVWPNPAGYEQRTTYQSEVDFLIEFLNKRYNFLNSEFSN